MRIAHPFAVGSAQRGAGVAELGIGTADTLQLDIKLGHAGIALVYQRAQGGQFCLRFGAQTAHALLQLCIRGPLVFKLAQRLRIRGGRRHRAQLVQPERNLIHRGGDPPLQFYDIAHLLLHSPGAHRSLHHTNRFIRRTAVILPKARIKYFPSKRPP